MNVKSIDILVGYTGTDKVSLNLDGVASPYPNMGYPATAVVDAQAGCGLAWAEKHFPGVEITLLDMKSGKKTIKRASGVVTTENLRPVVSQGFQEPKVERIEQRDGGFVEQRVPPRGDDRYPIQDNGPEIPDYGRGGDGPPAPWCRRCQGYHFNRCTR